MRLARRVRFCMSVSTGFGTPSSSRGRGVERRPVDAGDAQDLLDDVGLDLDVGAPGRDEHTPVFDAQSRAGGGSPRPRSRGMSTPSSRFTSL